MKKIALILSICLTMGVFASCSHKEAATETQPLSERFDKMFGETGVSEKSVTEAFPEETEDVTESTTEVTSESVPEETTTDDPFAGLFDESDITTDDPFAGLFDEPETTTDDPFAGLFDNTDESDKLIEEVAQSTAEAQLLIDSALTQLEGDASLEETRTAIMEDMQKEWVAYTTGLYRVLNGEDAYSVACEVLDFAPVSWNYVNTKQFSSFTGDSIYEAAYSNEVMKYFKYWGNYFHLKTGGATMLLLTEGDYSQDEWLEMVGEALYDLALDEQKDTWVCFTLTYDNSERLRYSVSMQPAFITWLKETGAEKPMSDMLKTIFNTSADNDGDICEAYFDVQYMMSIYMTAYNASKYH